MECMLHIGFVMNSYTYFIPKQQAISFFQIKFLVKLGVTEHFSALDRKLADWSILTQMTGQPWGLRFFAEQLKVTDIIIMLNHKVMKPEEHCWP